VKIDTPEVRRISNLALRSAPFALDVRSWSNSIKAGQYWFMCGVYEQKDGRKMDALVNYRNALALYPPRRPRPDRRDEVMASAERLWKDLGGTAQGWNDWATQSSLAGFYAGSGGDRSLIQTSGVVA